jgi:ketosteroid isomerase-like protein
VAAFDATITDVKVAASGDLAYETGVNHFVFHRNGDRVPGTGKYLAVWRRPDGGQWRIAALAVTNNPPQP